MPQPPTQTRQTCPNCHAAIPKGARACTVCKLEVAKMPGYAAAKKAAQQRGIKTTSVETRRAPLVSTGTIIKAAILLLVLGGIAFAAYELLKPKPPRYLKFPATAENSSMQFLTHISKGEDKDYDQAYGMIADSVRNPKADDEIGDYRQVFHIMNLYLRNEFGNDWITKTQVAADPADPNLIIAHVSLETLHIRVANQTPTEHQKDWGSHYAILGIDEFDIADAAKFKSNEGLFGAMRMLGAGGSVGQLKEILGSSGEPNNEPLMQKKLRLLPVVENPHIATWKSVVLLWNARKDPVVRARLEQITTDARYDPEIQRKADEVLKDKTSEEDRIAAGVRE